VKVRLSEWGALLRQYEDVVKRFVKNAVGTLKLFIIYCKSYKCLENVNV